MEHAVDFPVPVGHPPPSHLGNLRLGDDSLLPGGLHLGPPASTLGHGGLVPMAKTRQAQRRDRAEDVCWSLMIMMGLGALDGIPLEWRKQLADPLEEWIEMVDEEWVHKECLEDCPNPLHKQKAVVGVAEVGGEAEK